MFLGIEIGGTKLQLGVAETASSPILRLVRKDVDSRQGHVGIVDQIRVTGGSLLSEFSIDRIGIGFGGPVDAARGRVIKSHHVNGWEDFDLGAFSREVFSLPASIDNDCNVSALAEATAGAGAHEERVFYVTVGTGIGGGLVVDSKIVGSNRPTICELGHLRPEPFSHPERIVEDYASGPSIARNALRAFANDQSGVQSSLNEVDQLTAQDVAEAAIEGDQLARDILERAILTLGWAIGQVVNIVAPNVVVVGGGVSLIGEQHFYEPLRKYVDSFVIDPLRASYQIVAPAFGEDVVVRGALALAESQAEV